MNSSTIFVGNSVTNTVISYSSVAANTIQTVQGFTVATLPAAGNAGRRAFVTDANSAQTVFYTSVVGTGGHTANAPVFDTGSIWVYA